MSDMQDPQVPGSPSPHSGEAPPPFVIPVRYPPPPPPRPAGGAGAILRTLLVMALIFSIGANVIMMLLLGLGNLGDSSNSTVQEQFYSGKESARDKIAIVKIEGVIMEGQLGFVNRQIEQASSDSQVKAVVVRISSPGGTITASDDLHRRLVQLRDGTNPTVKSPSKKPLVVSMGAVAASGGYYIAAPAQYVMAEDTTITGSIGVYAAFPNVAELADKYGVTMNVIKAGEVKDSGSMFHLMNAQERQLWQDMVQNAFTRFIDIVERGRPVLKGKLREEVINKEIPDVDPKTGKELKDADGKPVMVKYIRRLADGGIYTAQEALKFKLVDELGYVDDAVKKAESLAGLSGPVRVITYDKPQTLASALFGVQAPSPGSGHLDASKLASGATPRLWYMAPQSELAGFLSAIGQ